MTWLNDLGRRSFLRFAAALRSHSELIEKIWRPRRDLNPCYRRERAMS
jgi:hypothetical protein